MKLNRFVYGVALAGCVCGLMLGSGCRPKTKVKGPVKDRTEGEVVGGPIDTPPMGERPLSTDEPLPVKYSNVLFAYNSFEVQESEVPKIKEVADYLKSNADVRVVNEGNCDERGTAEYNMALGENRAQSVRAFLISLGIDGDRIQTKSWGEEKPVEAGHSEAAWSKNRRVEFVFFKK